MLIPGEQKLQNGSNLITKEEGTQKSGGIYKDVAITRMRSDLID
jgi:hypothetical protein